MVVPKRLRNSSFRYVGLRKPQSSAMASIRSGVTIRNVDLKLMGGGPASEVTRPVPEAEKAYPENRMFKRQMLPAYGFYVRHADGVTFENVKLTYTGDTEVRPAIFIDDSTDVKTEGCSFCPPAGSYPAVYATGRKSPLPSR